MPPIEGSNLIFTQQSTISYGPEEQMLICPHCQTHIKTKLKTEPNTKTHILACFLFIFLCWPCICVPYFVDSCQNKNHYCPNCKAFLGTYEN